MDNTDRRLEETQQTADEVKDIMVDNFNRVEERSEKLSDLDTRAELLRTRSQKFTKTAVKVKRKKQWLNRKMKLLVAAVVLAVVVVLIITIAVAASGNRSTKEPIQQGAMTTVAPNEIASEG